MMDAHAAWMGRQGKWQLGRPRKKLERYEVEM
jgi:hypothetical protein